MSVTLDAVRKEVNRRVSINKSLVEYAKAIVGVTPALHHEVICNHLERLVNDEFDDLLICTPPGSAKSTYASHVFPSWYLGKNPKNNVIIASHTATLAEKWSRKVRDTVDSPAHKLLFPTSALSKDSTAVSKWTNVSGGECLAAGAGMSILGFRCDIAICDDLVSGWEQANSMTQLQKLQDWYKSDLKSRYKPNAKTVIINQRLSPNDIAGFVIGMHEENPTRRLKTLILPMVAIHDNPADDPLGRAKGDRLWPEWYTDEMVADLRKDDLIWRTMWQQEPPSDTGSWVSPEELRVVEPINTPSGDNLSHYIVSDLALSVNSGDYSTHIVCGIDANRNVYVLEAWRDRCDPNVTADKHLELTQTYRPMECLIDDDNASKVYVQLLASKAREKSIPIPWKALPIRGQDKETRAAALRGLFKRGKVFFKRGEWNRWLIKELLSFPNALGSGVDDGVDALSLLGRRMASLSSAAPAPVERPRAKYAHEATLNELWENHEHRLGNRSRL